MLQINKIGFASLALCLCHLLSMLFSYGAVLRIDEITNNIGNIDQLQIIKQGSELTIQKSNPQLNQYHTSLIFKL